MVPLLVGERLGQARAYNDVFKIVRTPYVAWISDDNEIVNGGLDVAVEILERQPTDRDGGAQGQGGRGAGRRSRRTWAPSPRSAS